MKRLLLISLLLLQIFSPAFIHAQEISDEEVEEMLQETKGDLADNLIFDNIASLAGSSCSLYALGIDLVNLIQWSFVDSLLELTVLFRNEPWRELIWAINDQREAIVNQLTSLEKQRCVYAFARPEAQFEDQEGQLAQQIADVEKKIIELEEKRDFLALQRRNMLFDQPQFRGLTQEDPDRFTLETLQTDKIFYFLRGLTNIEVNWEQFLSRSKQVGMEIREDLDEVFTGIPDDCFAIVSVGQELDLYFANKFRYQNGVYRDDTGREYPNFEAFVRDNGSEIVRQYIQEYCQASRDRALANADETSTQEQFRVFTEKMNQIISVLQKQLTSYESQIRQLENQQQQNSLSDTQREELSELYRVRGRLLAQIDYYRLVLQKVGSPESQSLDKLASSLESFAEAVLGVIRDDEGNKKSRISLAERFEKANERNLQEICSRIETMYRKAGRSTSDLPLIGYANGRRYCKATTNCADVDLRNLVGRSEGRKKLAECSGFLFDQSELGPSQSTQDVIDQTSEDLSLLLQERALNDLLKQRNLHFSSLRNKYSALFRSQTDTTAIVENVLQEVALGLYNPEVSEVYNPQSRNPKTHFALMRKIYQDFWKFMDQQEGSCDAPEELVF